MSDDSILSARISAIEDQLEAGDKRMAYIEAALDKNAAATQEVLEIVLMAKGFFRVLGGIGAGIKWIVGLAAAIVGLWTLWPSGTPPK
jgi:hypothetical protein